MKKIFFASLFAIATLLVGCDKLTQYSISEQEVNQALAKQENFSKNIGISGIADAQITLTNLSSAIGREEPNKIVLTGDATVDLVSVFGKQKATIVLKIKTQPEFDKEKGAIYLRDLNIIDAKVEPERMDSIIQTAMPYLNTSLQTYFDNHPAYVLSDSRSKGEALAKKMAKGIEVKPGEIIIPLAL